MSSGHSELGEGGDVSLPEAPSPRDQGVAPQAVETQSELQYVPNGAEGSQENNFAQEQRVRATSRRSELLDVFQKKLYIPSPSYGKAVWSLDETNTDLATEAMAMLATQEPSFRLRFRQRNIMALQGTIWILDASQLNIARQLGIFERLPNISSQEISDQSKGDFLVKFIAIVQSGWLIVQLLIRFARHLPSAQLELVAGAFAACSTIIYLLLLPKPQGVATPRMILASKYPTAEEMLEIAIAGPRTYFRYRKSYWIPNNAVHRIQWGKSKEPDVVDRYHGLAFLGGSVIGAIIFGAPHLFAWDFAFPTAVERLLWRISALLLVGLAVIGLIVHGILRWIYKAYASRHGTSPARYQAGFIRMVSWSIRIFAFPYLAARLFIVVEGFRSLCFLPPLAFVTTWATSVPHVE